MYILKGGFPEMYVFDTFKTKQDVVDTILAIGGIFYVYDYQTFKRKKFVIDRDNMQVYYFGNDKVDSLVDFLRNKL